MVLLSLLYMSITKLMAVMVLSQKKAILLLQVLKKKLFLTKYLEYMVLTQLLD